MANKKTLKFKIFVHVLRLVAAFTIGVGISNILHDHNLLGACLILAGVITFIGTLLIERLANAKQTLNKN